MTQPTAIAIARTLDAIMRSDRGRLLSILSTGLRDLALAEEALQEAAISAMSHWGRAGLPASPQGWLLTAARRKALDRLRGSHRDSRRADLVALLDGDENLEPDAIPDERLRLIFTYCHPALEMKSRVALTLRTVCGLTTTEIARVFLDQEATMGQRLSRAKAKIAGAGIPFEVPGPEHWTSRLDSVLTTVYLIFTTGYGASTDEPRDLCHEAEFLARLIDRLRPDVAEIEGALAMILLTVARRAARIGPDGASVPTGEQDRTRWDHDRIAEGRALLARAVGRRSPGPFQLKAAIADCHMAEGGPDWPQISALYGTLVRVEPTPVVALNHAVALAEAGDPMRALGIVESLAESLQTYQPWHAARAALLARTGATADAIAAYRNAIALATNPSDVHFLGKRLAQLLPEYRA